jgi:hypothetical protein
MQLWEHRLIDWLFRNRQTGQITIGQTPNIPILVFAAAWVLNVLFDPGGAIGTVLEVVSGVALAVWAIEELVSGVNPFRRLLGAFVLGGLLTRVLWT